ncbi:hypothetical protein [uncultured Megasphaera sp.]|uniref:hypothetical protein n=1 Tax=uncultured Megasphaera sp. TaxID=165188 RepID=UPI002659FC98|nr:hypothetical protein [uncultured Megasphaera sp.]
MKDVLKQKLTVLSAVLVTSLFWMTPGPSLAMDMPPETASQTQSMDNMPGMNHNDAMQGHTESMDNMPGMNHNDAMQEHMESMHDMPGMESPEQTPASDPAWPILLTFLALSVIVIIAAAVLRAKQTKPAHRGGPNP